MLSHSKLNYLAVWSSFEQRPLPQWLSLLGWQREWACQVNGYWVNHHWRLHNLKCCLVMGSEHVGDPDSSTAAFPWCWSFWDGDLLDGRIPPLSAAEVPNYTLSWFRVWRTARIIEHQFKLFTRIWSTLILNFNSLSKIKEPKIFEFS